MRINSIPGNPADRISLGTTMLEGMKNARPPLTFISVEEMGTDLNAYATANGTFNAARSARQTLQTNYDPMVTAVYDWLLGVKNMLVTPFGTRWNAQWAQAGFINHSVAIPRTVDAQMGLALLLSNFLTANPHLEVPTMNFTGVYGAGLRDAVITARKNISAETVVMDGALTQRTDTGTVLVTVMQSVIANLNKVLGKSDPRWVNFGLPIPTANRTPGKPVNLMAVLDAAGLIQVQCDAVPLATRYRFRMRVVGVDQDYQLAASSKEPLATIQKTVLPGNTMQIIVQAVDGSLQGVASDPVLLVLPPVSAKALAPDAASPALTLPAISLPAVSRSNEPVVSSNGLSFTNGHRNGNGVHAEAV